MTNPIDRLRQKLSDCTVAREALSINLQSMEKRANRWQERAEQAEREVERDRSTVADGVNAVSKAVRARQWLREGRGSYEYNDDRWKDEFGQALDEILMALEPLKAVAGNLKHCPQEWKDVVAAREDRATAAEAALAEALRERNELAKAINYAHEHGFTWPAEIAVQISFARALQDTKPEDAK